MVDEQGVVIKEYEFVIFFLRLEILKFVVVVEKYGGGCEQVFYVICIYVYGGLCEVGEIIFRKLYFVEWMDGWVIISRFSIL